MEIITILLGTIAGIITGLIPGLHANMLAAIIFSIAPTPSAAIFVISLAVTHTIIDAIPSAFLRASTDDTIAALHHSGAKTAKLMIIGSAFGLAASLIAAPLLWYALPKLYAFVRPATAPLLILVLGVFILRESTWKDRGIALGIVLASGLIGVLALDNNLNQPLLPLLSGLFGIPTLVFQSNSSRRKRIGKAKGIVFASILGVAGSSLLLLLPGLGPSQAAQMLLPLLRNPGSYIALVGGINTIDFTASAIMASTTGNARNGALEMASEIIKMNAHILGVITLAGGLAIIASMAIVRHGKAFQTIKLKYAIVLLIALLTLYFDALHGILVLITSSCIGILSLRTGINRSHCMACLIIPTIRYFL